MTADWSRYRLIDWQKAFEGSREEITWIAEPYLEKGTLNAVYCDPKDGKSLLHQAVAGALASGSSVLGGPPQQRMQVLYVDYENNQDLVVERLGAMGYEWRDLKGWLHYASYPDIPRLDTPDGGAALCTLAGHLQATVVIYDTTSKTIGDAENSADTFSDLYQYTHTPLLRAGITQVRLDHSGKDAERGQRGSSAKNADVDVVWRLVPAKNAAGLITAIRMEPEYRRADHATAWGAACLQGPLRFEIGRMPLTPRQQVIVKELSRLGLPPDAGRDACAAILRENGVKFRTDDLTAAVKHRKRIQDDPGWAQSGSGSSHMMPGSRPINDGSGAIADPMGQGTGQAGQTGSDLVGQGMGQMGQPTWGNDPTRSVGQDQSQAGLDWPQLWDWACKKCVSGARHRTHKGS